MFLTAVYDRIHITFFCMLTIDALLIHRDKLQVNLVLTTILIPR